MHKKFLLVLATLCSFLAFTACGKKSASSGSSSSGSGDSAGSAAIEFHNKLIDFSKLARGPLRKIVEVTKDSAEFVDRPLTKPRWDMPLLGINPYEKLAKSTLAAPSSFSKDDQEFFNSRIKLTKAAAAELNKIIDTLKAYYSAEDYKDDKHKKFLDLQPRIQTLVEQIATATGEMGDHSEEIATAAERETLKKDPIGIYILNMRDIMAKVEQQMELLTDDRMICGNENKSAEETAAAIAKTKELVGPAEALSTEIASMAEKFKAVDMSTLKKRPTLAKDYEDFFKRLDAQQGEVRKNIRFAKEHGGIGTASDVRNLGSTVGDVVRGHNNFIDDVNKGN